jgi:hypothetical protein
VGYASLNKATFIMTVWANAANAELTPG